MKQPIRRNQIWGKSKFRTGLNYFEIFEYKPIDTTLLICLSALTLPAVIALLAIQPFGPNGPGFFGIAIIVMLLLTPLFAMLAVYRLPRAVRVYPDDDVLHSFRRFCGIKLRYRYHDYSQSSLCVMHVSVEIKAPPSNASRFLGLTLGIFGLLATLIPLLDYLFSSSKQYLPAFALALESSPEKPYATFFQIDELNLLLEACGNEADISSETA